MFDIGWSEILVIATVAVIVVGPKELPRMLRAFGKTMGQVRRTANDFKRQFDEALREAEREAGLEETRKEIQSLGKDPLKDTRKDFDDAMRRTTATSAPAAESLPGPEPSQPGAAHQPATGDSGAVAPARGSDAA